jgi:thiol:disulfide interchange protein
MEADRDSVRHVPRWLYAASAVLLLGWGLSALRERLHPPAPPDLVHWKTAEQAETILAMEVQPTLYDFSAEWCEPCGELRKDVFGDEDGAKLANRYLAVRITDEDEKHSKVAAALHARFLVDSLPTLVITSTKLPTPIIVRGYPGRQKTFAFLRDNYWKALTGH